MRKTAVFVFVLLLSAFAYADTITVTDMRGQKVTIPKDPQRIATIDDGLVEGVMTHLGVIDRVVAIGSWAMKRDYSYDFETIEGTKYTLRGWHTMKYLHPWLNELPCVNSPSGDILNYEALAAVDPDLVIVRAGDCTVRSSDKAKMERTFTAIEALDIPLVVIFAPEGNDLSTMKQELAVIGEIFGQKAKAERLADYLFATQTLIQERTANMAEKPSLLYLALDPNVRQTGGAGRVYGTNTPESYIIETVANATNAFRSTGTNIPLSAEQIYAIDPDVIVLPTFNGYHPPRELYDSKYFEILSDLAAVKNKRIYAMPWSPMNCARRVEYPIDMLIVAKAAYPEQFKDIKLHDYVLQFYKDVYGVSDADARTLRSEQLLDWMVEADF